MLEKKVLALSNHNVENAVHVFSTSLLPRLYDDVGVPRRLRNRTETEEHLP